MKKIKLNLNKMLNDLKYNLVFIYKKETNCDGLERVNNCLFYKLKISQNFVE